jgi:hypothetical protein
MFQMMCELNLRLKIGDRGNVREIGITSELRWNESFHPTINLPSNGYRYFASMAASRKLYWSSKAGTLTVEITTSAPNVSLIEKFGTFKRSNKRSLIFEIGLKNVYPLL